MEPGTGIMDLSSRARVWYSLTGLRIACVADMIFQPRVVNTTMSHVRVLCTLSSPALDLVFSAHKRPY